MKTCDNCGKFYKPHRVTKKLAAKQKRFFCSRNCFIKFRESLITDSEKKTCLHCSEDKFLISFCRQKRKNDSYSYSKNCNTCRSKITKLKKFGREYLRSQVYLFCEETCREIKICSRCKTAKPITDYFLDKIKLNSRCKKCCKEVVKKRFDGMTAQEKAGYFEKYYKRRDRRFNKKPTPEQKKKYLENDKERFKKNPDLRKLRYERKKQFKAEKLAAMNDAERELYLERERISARRNNQTRRARKCGAKFNIKFAREDVIKRDGMNCYLCGRLLKLREVTLDHILPLARGGFHKPENAKIACMKCNLSKNSKTLTEFKKWRGDYDYLKKAQPVPTYAIMLT